MARRRALGRPWAAFHAAAGSQAGSPPFSPLRRPPSPPIGAYRRLVSVPIGNDGVAFPAIFTAAGVATCFAGPAGIGTVWEPAQASVSTSVGQLDPAQVVIYQGPAALPQYQVAAAAFGGGNQIALGGVQLVPGWFVWAVWTGGTPGATAYLTVTGAKQALTQ